jgi:putative ABC transport system permease protein
MRDAVTSSGDPVAYITLRDAQALQFELAPPAVRREQARGGAVQGSDQINAVIAKVSQHVRIDEVAASLSRWKHLEAITQANQENLLSKFVIERARKQMGLIMVLLVIVSAVIIALIVYTLTMDKVRSIATLKFVGAPDRTIIGLIVQQALSMGIFGYLVGLALVVVFKPYFPRRLVLDPESIGIVFVIIIVVCLAASTLGIRLALKVDPAEALASSG